MEHTESDPIRFIQTWQGHTIGEVNATLPLTVRQELVEHGFARWVSDQPVPPTPRRVLPSPQEQAKTEET